MFSFFSFSIKISKAFCSVVLFYLYYARINLETSTAASTLNSSLLSSKNYLTFIRCNLANYIQKFAPSEKFNITRIRI